MLDLTGVKALGETFLWFLSLGESDAKQIRDELQDLLSHCSQTLKSLGELTEALYGMKPEQFTEQTYLPVYFHCVNNYTSPEAARRARSHCTDIQRDVARMRFKLTRLLRTEIGSWKSLDAAFGRLVDADEDFLDQFEKDMSRVDRELTEVVGLLGKDRQEAWRRYEELRSALLQDLAGLSKEFRNMREAEDHIRRVLT
ncbi:MAG: hypothetical protein KJ025_16275 [Burkholderiales bacterium]|nr:hypothetical protein [Burkholderiales bacterium]